MFEPAASMLSPLYFGWFFTAVDSLALRECALTAVRQCHMYMAHAYEGTDAGPNDWLGWSRGSCAAAPTGLTNLVCVSQLCNRMPQPPRSAATQRAMNKLHTLCVTAFLITRRTLTALIVLSDDQRALYAITDPPPHPRSLARPRSTITHAGIGECTLRTATDMMSEYKHTTLAHVTLGCLTTLPPVTAAFADVADLSASPPERVGAIADLGTVYCDVTNDMWLIDLDCPLVCETVFTGRY